MGGGTKFLTDKAHRDGSPVRRNRSDVVKKPEDPAEVHRDYRPVSNDARKSSPNKKSSGTPMKKLIAQEMLKETDSKRKQPSIVARLMGLDDALPVQQPALATKRNAHVGYPRSKSVGALRGRKKEEDIYIDRSKSQEIHTCTRDEEYTDVYAVFQQPFRTNPTRDQAPLKEKYDDNQRKKRMDLVRQKFMEAKRLSIDEKLLQSKEFQDALEVLSSNRDLFLKFLEEPNSLFSKHTKEPNAVPSLPQTKRITLLKPSKTVEPNAEKHMEKQQHPPSSGNVWDIDKTRRGSNLFRQKTEDLSQPTRIVVLKPSPAKTSDIKTATSTSISSSELPQPTDVYRHFETSEAVGSREISTEITEQWRESVSSHRRDESLLSSVLSNGYAGDDSSFDQSENEYIEENTGNFSDSEIMTPTSQNSWDNHNRIGSPCSFYSFSRRSYSPESSVIREAKKRLSDRWALVASSGRTQEDPMQAWRSSSTLGDMLAKPEVKKKGKSSASSSKPSDGEQLRAPTAVFSVGRAMDVDGKESSAMTLSRSQSVPVSSSAYENIELNMETSGSQNNKSVAPKEATKSKSGKSSFKGKLSSFFSRNKKSAKQKTVPSLLVGSVEINQSGSPEFVLNYRNTIPDSDSVYGSSFEDSLLVNSEEQSSKASSPASVKDRLRKIALASSLASVNDGLRKGAFSSKVAISLEKPRTSANVTKNQGKLGTSENSSRSQDQPSPTSILDASFDDDLQSNKSTSSEIINAGHPQVLSRSAPIESVSRSLSWDDTNFGISSPNPLKFWRKDDEEHWFESVQYVLSSAGLDNVRVNSVFTGWHSPESPLNSMVLFNIMDWKDGAESKEIRSSQRLLFDCVNVALLDIGNTALLNAYPWVREYGKSQKHAPAGSLVTAEVWNLVRGLFSIGANLVSSENDNSSLLADRLLRKEVAGSGWAELMRMEMDEVCQEIGEMVLEVLVSEALLDFTSECL